jgi:hypothetical protein
MRQQEEVQYPLQEVARIGVPKGMRAPPHLRALARRPERVWGSRRTAPPTSSGRPSGRSRSVPSAPPGTHRAGAENGRAITFAIGTNGVPPARSDAREALRRTPPGAGTPYASAFVLPWLTMKEPAIASRLSARAPAHSGPASLLSSRSLTKSGTTIPATSSSRARMCTSTGGALVSIRSTRSAEGTDQREVEATDAEAETAEHHTVLADSASSPHRTARPAPG